MDGFNQRKVAKINSGLVCYEVARNLRCFADFYSLRKDVEITSQRVKEIRESSGQQLLEQELANLEEEASASSFWDDRAKAQETLSTLADVKDKIKLLNEFKTQVRYNSVTKISTVILGTITLRTNMDLHHNECRLRMQRQ